MLKINQFYWRLYKESPKGKQTIALFENASQDSFTIDETVSLFKEFDPVWFLNVNEDETKTDYFDACFSFLGDWNFDVSKTPRKNAEEMIATRFNGDYGDAVSCIAPLSFYLYKKDPSYYIPYMFLLRYHYIRQIMEDYDLDIMEVPGKADFKARCYYYLDICDALTLFREFNGLTGPELCAFLYDMERERYDAAY